MNPMLKVSAAVLIAAMSVPAFAAVDSATVIKGTSDSIMAASSLDGLVGHLTMQDLSALGGARNVTVFDTKSLYDSNDLAMISDAETRSLGDLAKLHQEINGNPSLKAWFAHNNINVNDVIAVTDTGGSVDVYLY